MRPTLLAVAALLAHASAGHAELGGLPAEFESGSTTIVSNVASASSNYTVRDTTLPAGTRVREYIAGTGIVFGVAWDGPFLPDLNVLLGKHFDAMAAESAKAPKAGRSRLTVVRPDVVILSGGHMRAFEGRAWVPTELPAGVSTDVVR